MDCPARSPAGTTTCPFLDWGPRVGIAWDVTGDGKTAIRAAGGIFYNFLNQRPVSVRRLSPLIARENVVRNATLDDVTAFAQAGTTSFAETPADGEPAG